MGLLTPKTPFHPTFIEASYELLPSQENTRLNLFFQKKKKEKVKPKGFLWAPATPREHKTHPYSTSPSSAFSALKLWFESFSR